MSLPDINGFARTAAWQLPLKNALSPGRVLERFYITFLSGTLSLLEQILILSVGPYLV